MSTVFDKIVQGNIPSYKILEDDRFLAFLDVSPLKEGHTLVIPKKHTDFIFDMPDEELAEMWLFAKKVAQAIKIAYGTRKVGVAVLGLEVHHAHIHLVPLDQEQDINFSNPRLALTNADYEEISDKIIACL